MPTCAEHLHVARASATRGSARACLLLVFFTAAHAGGAPKELAEARVGKVYEYAVVYEGLVEPVKAEWRGLPDWLIADGPRLRGTPREVTRQPLEFAVALTGQLGEQLQGQFRLAVVPAIRPLTLVKSAIPTLPVGEPISIQFAANGGEGKLSWEVQWATRISGIDAQIDNQAGTCRLAGTAATEGQGRIQVIVRDEMGAMDQHQFQVQVRAYASPLRIARAGLPNATFSYPYVAYLAAEGGRPPYRWEIQWQISPPPGLSVTGDEGKIEGTPTCLGQYPFVAVFEDASGARRQTGGTLAVVAPKCAPFLVQRELPTFTVGRPFEVLLHAQDLMGNVKWTISGAPSWLRWENPHDGICCLSATHPESGTWLITAALSITAPILTDSGESVREIGNTSRVFSLNVRKSPPLRFRAIGPLVAVQGVPYQSCFITEGGEEPVELTFSDGLPDSITASSNGTIYTNGIQRPGVFAFTITASSRDGQKADFNTELRVIPAEFPPPLEFSGVSRLNGLFVQESTLPAPAHGGVPPYEASIESSSRIEAVSSSSKDTISFRLRRPFGVRTQVHVHDSAGQKVTGSVVIQPVVPLEIAVLGALALLLVGCSMTLLFSKPRLSGFRPTTPTVDLGATTGPEVDGTADMEGQEETRKCECCGRDDVPPNELVRIDSGQWCCPHCLEEMRGRQ